MKTNTSAAAWFAAQPKSLLAKLRSPEDAGKLLDYADRNASDVPTCVADWTEKDLLAAIGYDPLKAKGALLEPARETIKAFEELLAAKGFDYYITWCWEGWRRYGVIGIRPGGAANVLAPAIDREVFARSDSTWGDADRTIGRVRTGSPKHLAIRALLTRLAA